MMRFTDLAHALVAPSVSGWPSPIMAGVMPRRSADDVIEALAEIRRQRLWWPTPRRGAARPKVVAVGPECAIKARRWRPEDEPFVIESASRLADVDPDELEAVFCGGHIWRLSVMGGVAGALETSICDEIAVEWLRAALCRSPWTGEDLNVCDAVEAAALLASAARRARGPLVLVGMSRWKRRGLRPFLKGPDGMPLSGPAALLPSDLTRLAGDPAEASRNASVESSVRALVWASAIDEDASGSVKFVGEPSGGNSNVKVSELLRAEDGFIRSVGFGLRHEVPTSVAIFGGRPHYDGRAPNAFDEVVAAAEFTPRLLDRARALRARIVSIGVTKYNMGASRCLVDAGDREVVLVAGQVEDDASVRLGAIGVRGDAALLQAARDRYPDAFLLYRPHPDATSGLRQGLAPAEVVERCADAVETRASAAACLARAKRVITVTSGIGFEGVLRDIPVTTFGRPFYAGWGLTEDVVETPWRRRLSLDELTAAALILYPSYVDVQSGLACSPEIALDRIEACLSYEATRVGRIRRAWLDVVSSVMARL